MIISDSAVETCAEANAMVSAACPVTVLLCYLAWLIPKTIDLQEETGNVFPLFSHLDGERYDFIIVGGGSAGCVVASR
jgi:hypothetical protein